MQPSFADITTTILIVIAGVTCFNLLVTAYNNLRTIRKPSEELWEMVQRHERLLSTDNDRLKELEDSNQLMLKAMLQMIQHDIDGNHTDKLKEIRDEIHGYLISK